LIDEIDKAGRDFPNDLLNGIQRLEFRIRELADLTLRAADDEDLRPIVIITSNSERDLPGPFLRRCTYFDIPDPDQETLQRILLARVFPNSFMAEAMVEIKQAESCRNSIRKCWISFLNTGKTIRKCTRMNLEHRN